jgi:hypothetical protein
MSGTLTEKGVLLVGDPAKVVKVMISDINEAVADKVLTDVKTKLHDVLMHPTGYYESHVQTSTQTDSMVISDGGVIYGPWLEGLSSRNARSRFKGYSTFRKVAQQAEQEAQTAADDAAAKRVGELNQ